MIQILRCVRYIFHFFKWKLTNQVILDLNIHGKRCIKLNLFVKKDFQYIIRAKLKYESIALKL